MRLCCGAAAGPKCAEAISRRKAGTARRPSTRARWLDGGDTREPTPSPRRKTRPTTQGGDAYGASGTSFYTTTEKQDSYDSLDKVLDAKCKDAGVRKVIVEMLDACGEITEALRSALVTVCVKINFRGAL